MIEYLGETFDLPRELLPADAAEGDVINISIGVDRERTLSRRRLIEGLMDDLFED